MRRAVLRGKVWAFEHSFFVYLPHHPDGETIFVGRRGFGPSFTHVFLHLSFEHTCNSNPTLCEGLRVCGTGGMAYSVGCTALGPASEFRLDR